MNDEREVAVIARHDNGGSFEWRTLGRTFKRQGQARKYATKKGYKTGVPIYY